MPSPSFIELKEKQTHDYVINTLNKFLIQIDEVDNENAKEELESIIFTSISQFNNQNNTSSSEIPVFRGKDGGLVREL